MLKRGALKSARQNHSATSLAPKIDHAPARPHIIRIQTREKIFGTISARTHVG